MSSPYEGSLEDLFNFPEVPGLEEFGLVPPVREGADLSEFELESGSLPPLAPAPEAPEEEADDGDRSFVAEARPNPPVPDGVSDLDEDLFGFDELFSLEDDPFYNGTLGADGMPTNDIFVAAANETPDATLQSPTDSQGEIPAQPEQVAPSPEASAAPVEQPIAAAPAPAAATPSPEAVPQTAGQTAPQTAAAALPTQPRPAPTAPPPGSMMGQPPAAASLDRGPRILLPEDVPYGGPDNSKMIWALIACFLIVNTGIFWLAHMASTNVNNSLTQATGLIASALAQGQGQLPRAGEPAPTVASTPPDAGGDVAYEVETQPEAAPPVAPAPPAPILPAEEQAPERALPDALTPDQPEPWVDPRDFSDPLTFAVNSAKAMLEAGRFEDARRLLNHVLANQATMPLKVSLRQEIDFLIGLTYYAQGTTTAPETDEVPR